MNYRLPINRYFPSLQIPTSRRLQFRTCVVPDSFLKAEQLMVTRCALFARLGIRREHSRAQPKLPDNSSWLTEMDKSAFGFRKWGTVVTVIKWAMVANK